ncbi:hypothetical protein C8R47DRAFT_1075131 [Mycena vitilis]|nr:hypothetical protein C8R47DRAFT_1075131 [Mycena vitilis]
MNVRGLLSRISATILGPGCSDQGLQLLKKANENAKEMAPMRTRPISPRGWAKRNGPNTSIALLDDIVKVKHAGVVEMCHHFRFFETITQKVVDDLRDVGLPVSRKRIVEQTESGIFIRVQIRGRDGGQLMEKGLVHRPLASTKKFLEVAHECPDTSPEL